MTIDELIKILEMQEQILQFSHFNNADAWELGNIIVVEAKKREIPIAISIQLNNGYIVFQYGMDGTTLLSQDLLRKKHNTVKTTEKSSLHVGMFLRKEELALKDWCLDESDHTTSGGGFPIRVEEVGVIGTITISGIEHIVDHDILIKCISRYLHIDEVPRIRATFF